MINSGNNFQVLCDVEYKVVNLIDIFINEEIFSLIRNSCHRMQCIIS